MLIPKIFPSLVLLGLVTITLQVDIIMQSIPDIATCPNIQPGQCCLPPVPRIGSRIVRFSNLRATNIAAIWRERLPENGEKVGRCSGSIVASRPGPGAWIWRYDNSDIERKGRAISPYQQHFHLKRELAIGWLLRVCSGLSGEEGAGLPHSLRLRTLSAFLAW